MKEEAKKVDEDGGGYRVVAELVEKVNQLEQQNSSLADTIVTFTEENAKLKRKAKETRDKLTATRENLALVLGGRDWSESERGSSEAGG